MSSTRVKGNALSMLVNHVDYWADATAVVMDREVRSVPTLCAPPGEFVDYWFFDVSAVQSTDPDSFWSFLWDNTGATVPFAYAPHGNTWPDESRPHFTGLLTLPAPPAVGGGAGADVEQTFTVRLPINQGPLRVTTT